MLLHFFAALINCAGKLGETELFAVLLHFKSSKSKSLPVFKTPAGFPCKNLHGQIAKDIYLVPESKAAPKGI